MEAQLGTGQKGMVHKTQAGSDKPRRERWTHMGGVLARLTSDAHEAEEFARRVRSMKRRRKAKSTLSVFLLRKENYKVVANVGATNASVRKMGVLVDTGAGPNSVGLDIIPEGDHYRIRRPIGYQVFDASGSPLRVIGTVTLLVQIGESSVKADFVVCESLQVPILLGTDFTDKHIHNCTHKTVSSK